MVHVHYLSDAKEMHIILVAPLSLTGRFIGASDGLQARSSSSKMRCKQCQQQLQQLRRKYLGNHQPAYSAAERNLSDRPTASLPSGLTV